MTVLSDPDDTREADSRNMIYNENSLCSDQHFKKESPSRIPPPVTSSDTNRNRPRQQPLASEINPKENELWGKWTGKEYILHVVENITVKEMLYINILGPTVKILRKDWNYKYTDNIMEYVVQWIINYLLYLLDVVCMHLIYNGTGNHIGKVQ